MITNLLDETREAGHGTVWVELDGRGGGWYKDRFASMEADPVDGAIPFVVDEFSLSADAHYNDE